MPKVLIGTPTYEGKSYCLTQWIAQVLKVLSTDQDMKLLIFDTSRNGDYALHIRRLGIECVRIEPTSSNIETICKARGEIYRTALQGEFDFLLSLEQDVFPPPNILDRLITWQKHIVGVPYAIRTYTDPITRRALDVVTSAYDPDRPVDIYGQRRFLPFLESELRGKGLIQVEACGLGCTLISTYALSKIKARCDLKAGLLDDALFFVDARQQGFEAYVDTTLLDEVKHYPEVKRSYSELIRTSG
jgi:hypothetical protein